MKHLITIFILCFVITASVTSAREFTLSEEVQSILLQGRWEKIYASIKSDSIRVDDPVSRMLIGHACLATMRNYGASKMFTTLESKEDISAWLNFTGNLAEKNPDNDIAVYLKADGLLRTGKYDEAIAGFDKAIELNKMLTIAYYQRGNIYELANKNLSNAIADYKNVLQINPRFARAYLNLGNVFHEKGNLQTALDYYAEAIKADSQFAQPYYNRGNIYHEMGEYDKAILEFDQSIQLRPLWADAFYNRGNVYLFGKEEFVNAVFEYDKAIQINATHNRAICNRGVARSRNGEYPRAISDFTKVLRNKEDDAEAYSNRGNAYAHLNEIEKALDDYNRAIHFNPRMAEAYENRGFLYMIKIGDKAKACTDWKKACELGRCDNYNLAKKNGDCE
ncbi:MAG: tetratricopeptide repeat protein [candidate division Zixibacteria bacterium]|nr:tetratricopeptide repeat protein [candidate division Zixibacteria bacterium]